MDVVFKFCAGLDVHKKIIVACVLLSSPEAGISNVASGAGAASSNRKPGRVPSPRRAARMRRFGLVKRSLRAAWRRGTG